ALGDPEFNGGIGDTGRVGRVDVEDARSAGLRHVLDRLAGLGVLPGRVGSVLPGDQLAGRAVERDEDAGVSGVLVARPSRDAAPLEQVAAGVRVAGRWAAVSAVAARLDHLGADGGLLGEVAPVVG